MAQEKDPRPPSSGDHLRVAVFGATGYTGVELVRLCEFPEVVGLGGVALIP